MRKFKNIVAIGLALTLVLGASLSAFAGDNDGSATGAGTSEGHVDKKATSVVLPTIAEGTTPFAYTMDPERLIVATSHGKYGDAVEFPASNDTGVYFNNGKKGGEGTDKDNIVYANSSAAQKVTNKSSHAINLTVSVAASSADTDIPLVASSAISTAEAASLYLGLKVGSENAVAISTAEAATKTVSIAGTEANFKVAVKSDNSGYEYRALTLTEYQALDGNSSKTQADYDATWANTTFQLEGAVTSGKSITSTTTAPTVTVTWSWTDPTAAPATVSVTVVNKGDYTGDDTTVTMTVGSAAVAPTAVDGYTFAGYYTDAALTEAFEGNVAANTATLYAKWTVKPITATPGSFDSETTAAVISYIPAGATLSSVEYIKADGTQAALTEGTHWSYNASTNTFTVLKPALNGSSYAGAKWVLTFGDDSVEIPVVAE